MITTAQQNQWHQDGFFIIRGFAKPDVGQAMLQRVVEVSRKANGDVIHDGFIVTAEQNLAEVNKANVDGGCAPAEHTPAEQKVSKIFRLHRDQVFRNFIESPEILNIGRSLLGPKLDCFLSQFIFKNPNAWGQPWHQDSYYFPFDRSPQVGFWLAVTEATLDNGCLWVMPGSHSQPIHQHQNDRRPGANLGYVEIVDYDFSNAQPVTMAPGDLLVFHSHLMHRSQDNVSDGLRAAMVYHLAEHGTLDQSKTASPVTDWMALPDPVEAPETTENSHQQT